MSTKKRKASDDEGDDHKRYKPEEEADFCARNLLAKNPNISKETAESICLAMNNILTTQKRDHIPEMFESLLDIWFKNGSVVEEIFKTIGSKDLCFLHSVRYDFEDKKFIIKRHNGRKTYGTEDLDFKKYFTDQIEKCKSNLMALPISYNIDETRGHATMVVIEKGSNEKDGKQVIEVEHFDSSNIAGDRIKEPLENLIKSLFGEDNYVFRFHHQDEVCNTKIQGVLKDQIYTGSCTHFAIWYAFKRLLEPHKKRDRVVREMYELFNGKKDPDEVMIGLIHTFQSLLRFDSTWDDKFYGLSVNDRDVVDKKLAAEIEKTDFENQYEKFKEARDNCRKKCLQNNHEKYQTLVFLKNDEEFEKFCLEDSQSEDVKKACNHAKTLREKMQERITKFKRQNPDRQRTINNFYKLTNRIWPPKAGGMTRRKKRRVSKTRRKK